MSEKQSKFIFVRHGETDWNRERRWQGHADVPLNETGRRQAAALGARLAGWTPKIEYIFSSDLQRCTQTAALVSAALDLPVQYDPIWRERDVGAFQGHSHEENKQRFPELFALPQNAFLAPPDGETYIALQDRGVRAFAGVQTAVPPGSVVLIVSHGAILRALFGHIIGLPPGDLGHFSTGGNTGLSEVVVRSGKATLIRLNDTSHLENGKV